jgi:hypothetical protein
MNERIDVEAVKNLLAVAAAVTRSSTSHGRLEVPVYALGRSGA